MSSAFFLNADPRYLFLAQLLHKNNIESCFCNAFTSSSKNFRTLPFDTTQLADYDYIFGPIPLTKDQLTVNHTSLPLTQLLDALSPNQCFLSCNIPLFFRKELQRKQISFIDYNDEKTFQLKNAIATAEGTIAWAIEHSSGTLFQSNVLVLGYGCCGNQLVRLLNGFHTNLTIAGRRKETQTKVYCDGYQYLDLTQPSINLSSYRYIFNTIPVPILDETILKTCTKDCTIVDIASAPGGLDYTYAQRAKLNAHLYLGIPGKIAPKESANVLYEIIKMKL